MRRQAFPLVARLAFTLWMLAWVPLILTTQGGQNFFWLCDLAQFILLYCLWRPNPLLVSSQAGTVVLVGLVWMLDLLVGLVAGGSVTGITAYMFNPELALGVRLSSTYHLWLPLFVLWMCWYNGYDNRGVWLQCLIGSLAILAAGLWTDPERNINYAYAPFGIEQVWMPHVVYLPALAAAAVPLVYLPGHWLVRWVLRRLPRRGA